MNIPRLALPGTAANPVGGLSLDAAINGTGDVDVFWLGALSPNWRLELKHQRDGRGNLAHVLK